MNRLAPERAVLWMPMDGMYDVAGVRSTRNLGRALSAPEHVQVGNGVTATTFPAQRSPRGMYFDGGDTLQVPNAQMPDLGNNFTLACLFGTLPTGGTDYGALIDKSSSGVLIDVPYTFWWSGPGGGAQVQGYIYDGVGYVGALSPSVLQRGENMFGVFTCSDTQLVSYLNNAASVPVARTRNSVNNALPLIIGADNAVGAAGHAGVFGPVAIYPYALTPNEVRELGYRFREIARIPR